MVLNSVFAPDAEAAAVPMAKAESEAEAAFAKQVVPEVRIVLESALAQNACLPFPPMETPSNL